jgi:Transposase C of IS166 homeodomain
MIRFDDLPFDPLLLKQKLIETTSIIEKVSAEKVALADERNVAIAQRDAALQENEKLLLMLSQYKRALFGRRSEKMDADQLQLLLSENEASIVAGAANENAAADGALFPTRWCSSLHQTFPRRRSMRWRDGSASSRSVRRISRFQAARCSTSALTMDARSPMSCARPRDEKRISRARG